MAAFFLTAVVLGLLRWDDYGVGFDEPNNRAYGEIVLHHVRGTRADAPYYRDPGDWDNPTSGQFALTHGPVFEWLLAWGAEALDLTDPRDIYRLRHSATFLCFCLGAFFLYLFCLDAFHSRATALLAALFLFASPALIPHAYINSVDTAFLSAYAINMFSLERYLARKTWRRAAVHGVVSALAVDIRIAGLVIPACTLIFSSLDVLVARDKPDAFKRAARTLPVFLAVLFVVAIALWPVLWRDPLGGFLAAFQVSARDPFPFPQFFRGEWVPRGSLPWSFTPVWIAITTPPLYLFLFVIGVLDLIRGLPAGRELYLRRRPEIIALACFTAPLLAVACFRSTLFNGWRHLFFIYPAFLTIAAGGFVAIRAVAARLGAASSPRGPAAARALSLALVGCVATSLAFTARFVAASHPHELVYFNFLVGGLAKAKERFEVPLWNAEHREELEYILRHRPGRASRVFAQRAETRLNLEILDPGDRARLVFVESPAEADYFLPASFQDCGQATDYSRILTEPPAGFQPLWTRSVDGVPIAIVYGRSPRP